jgi:hypothetical protein
MSQRSQPVRICAVARAMEAPRRTPCPATSRTRLGTSCRRATTMSPRTFTVFVTVAAAAWRAWTYDSRTERRSQEQKVDDEKVVASKKENLHATMESAAVSWARTTARSDCTTSSSAARR